jgi:hypothetical protein
MKQPVGKYFASLSIIAAALTFSVPAANAALITGNLKIAGVGQVAISTGLIDFQPTGVGGGATGLARVVDGSTGSFASLVGGTVDLHDISNAAVPTGQPNQDFTFVTAFAGHNWTIKLDQMDEGVFAANPATNCPGLPAAAGQVCTPSIGPVKNPFSFLNTSPNSSTVSVTFTGRAIDNDNPQDVTAVRGVVGATFSEDNFQSLLAQAATGVTITTSYSGTITAVPEPSSAAMTLIGALLVAGMVAGRRLVG